MSLIADVFGRYAASVIVAVGFFTRVPVFRSAPIPGLSESMWAAPVAGMLVGAVVGTTAALSAWAGSPVGIVAVLAIAAGLIVTGALHEDGLADVADGFGGGRTREEKLTIMRDSRIGSYGTLALIVSLIARWSALSALVGVLSLPHLVWTVIAIHGASRSVLPAFMRHVEAARTDGLSRGAGDVPSGAALVALLLGAALMAPAGPGFLVTGILVLAAAGAGMAGLCRRQIGGQTGDVLGALQQACEIALFIVAATLLT